MEHAVLLSFLKESILAMEEEMQHGKQEIASLRHKISRAQESFEKGIRTEAELRSRRVNEGRTACG
jgi:predicted  nucleic acid-binding Zn-ribbon protein